jgi:hypothetical protein
MYNRDSRGRFSRKTKFFLIVGCGLALAIIYSIAIDNEIKIENKPVIVPEVKADSIDYAAKIMNIKTEMLKDLSLGCETKTVKEPDATILLDTNNQMSIGRYQFQIATIQFYVKKFEQRDITRVEAIQIAIDADRAGKLAEQILFGDPNGWKNWMTCANKLGLPKEIEILNQLR